jgi:uncharacterized protein YndB with AHSA1/START domain
MSRLHVETERVIAADPKRVYAFLADYRDKRPQILPVNFLDYTVEQGGRGAGTVIRYRLRAARRERPYQMRVEEPEKGRVLRERDANSSLVTTWTLTSTEDGRQTRVTLASEWEGAQGIGGFFERTFAPSGLRRIYADMLDKLALAVGSGSAAPGRVPR